MQGESELQVVFAVLDGRYTQASLGGVLEMRTHVRDVGNGGHDGRFEQASCIDSDLRLYSSNWPSRSNYETILVNNSFLQLLLRRFLGLTLELTSASASETIFIIGASQLRGTEISTADCRGFRATEYRPISRTQ